MVPKIYLRSEEHIKNSTYLFTRDNFNQIKDIPKCLKTAWELFKIRLDITC